MVHKRNYYIINGITLYRLIAAPFLFYLVLNDKINIFKWLLAFSFLTDAIDGFLARKFNVVSVLGARLDSLADDLTVLVGAVGAYLLKPEFVDREMTLIFVLIALYLVQALFALIRYGRISNFHTYMAKISAVFQGVFLILLFFLPEVPYLIFYLAAGLTIIQLIEEIILVFLLREWKTDVKGLYWVVKKRSLEKNSAG